MARYVPQFRIIYANSALTQKNIENVLNVWGTNLLAFLVANPEAHQMYIVKTPCSLVVQLLFADVWHSDCDYV